MCLCWRSRLIGLHKFAPLSTTQHGSVLIIGNVSSKSKHTLGITLPGVGGGLLLTMTLREWCAHGGRDLFSKTKPADRRS